MIIATAQSVIGKDIRENGQRIRALMRQAAAEDARLIHFSEGALSGYAKSEIQSWSDVDWGVVEEELASIATLAMQLGIWVVLGCAHQLAPPHLPKNGLYIISDEGEIADRYDKRFLSHSEVNGWYTPGTAPIVFEVDGLRFGCVLCIEVCFPELFAEYEALDVDCMLLSTYSRDPVHGLMARAHAATNCYWLSLSVPAQCSDDLPTMVIGPDGGVIAEAIGSEADLILADIDRNAPRYAIALQHARPWRRRAKSGEIYGHRR